MTYRLQKKNLPAPPPQAAAPASVEDQQAAEQQADDGRQWAGEPYEGADAPTGPEGAYSVFSHPSGEVAWLDRADDGTLTGWVQGSDGILYRYTDADAWAVDVDGAEMAMVEGQGPSGDAMEDEAPDGGELPEDGDEGELPEGEEEVDPFMQAEGDPEEGESDPFADPNAEKPEDALAEQGEDSDEEVDAELDEFDDAELDEFDDMEADDDEDEDEDDPVSRFKRGSKGKYLMTVSTGE